jgi:hypothetical protein
LNTIAGRVRPMPRSTPQPTACVPSKIWNAPAIGRIAAHAAITAASGV